MKKVFRLLLLIIVFASLLGGCEGKQTVSNTDDSDTLIDMVKSYERNEYLLRKNKISYATFKNNLKDSVVDNFGYKDQDVAFMTSEKRYTYKELEGMSIEEIKEIADVVHEKLEDKNLVGEMDWTTEISKIYEDDYRDWKHVMSKRIYEFPEGVENHIDRHYTFTKENDTWKILNIGDRRNTWIESVRNKRNDSKEEWLKRTKLHTFKGEDVDYTIQFDPSKP